jgi:hypothetical protein
MDYGVFLAARVRQDYGLTALKLFHQGLVAHRTA